MRAPPYTVGMSFDPLFWLFLFFALIVAIVVLGFVKVVVVLSRREPGHHPQHAQGFGTNVYDASTNTRSSVEIGEVNINVPRRRPPRR